MVTTQQLDAPVRSLVIDLTCTQIECQLGATTKVTYHGRPLEVHLDTTGTNVTITHQEPGLATDIVDGKFAIFQLPPAPPKSIFDDIASIIATSGLSRFIDEKRGKFDPSDLKDVDPDRHRDLGLFGIPLGTFGDRRI